MKMGKKQAILKSSKNVKQPKGETMNAKNLNSCNFACKQPYTYREYYKNRSLKLEENFSNGKLNGCRREFYDNGMVKVEEHWKDGKLDGVRMEYNENGFPIIGKTYSNGIINGIVRKYKSYLIEREVEFRDGIVDSVTTFDKFGFRKDKKQYKNEEKSNHNVVENKAEEIRNYNVVENDFDMSQRTPENKKRNVGLTEHFPKKSLGYESNVSKSDLQSDVDFNKVVLIKLLSVMKQTSNQPSNSVKNVGALKKYKARPIGNIFHLSLRVNL